MGWEEDHGIHVGYCHSHKIKVWDDYCEECDEETTLCSECEDLSECCCYE